MWAVCRPNKGSGSFPTGAGALQITQQDVPFVQFFTPLTVAYGTIYRSRERQTRQRRRLQLSRVHEYFMRTLRS